MLQYIDRNSFGQNVVLFVVVRPGECRVGDDGDQGGRRRRGGGRRLQEGRRGRRILDESGRSVVEQ